MWLLLGCAGRSMDCAGVVQDSPAMVQDSPVVVQDSPAVVLRGGVLLDEQGARTADIRLEDGVIVAVGAVEDADAAVVDVSGMYITPAFIDSHVHLDYQPDAAGMLEGGVAAAVDLASRLAFLDTDLSPLIVLRSGPMITAEGGYPTQSWGAGGYGLECRDDEAAAAVAALADAGAGVIKLPITGDNTLHPDALRAVADEAHARDLRVVSHATADADAALAAQIGADALAHTPTEALGDPQAWTDRAVITTLAAFGGSATAVENLRALRAAGAVVLYGTDFGNLRTPGISASELALLQSAGMSGLEILASGTWVPAAWWGMADLGRLEVGAAASLLVLPGDPRADPLLLAAPAQVWIAGVQR